MRKPKVRKPAGRYVTVLLFAVLLIFQTSPVFAQSNGEGGPPSAGGDIPVLQQQVKQLQKELQDLQRKVQQLKQKKENEKETKATELKGSWHHGFLFKSKDKRFSFKPGVVMQSDWTFASADNSQRAATPFTSSTCVKCTNSPIEDGNHFRRLQLYFTGRVYGDLEYKSQFSFETSKVVLLDQWFAITKLPFGGIRVGRFKMPISLSQLSAGPGLNFDERPLSVAFLPGTADGRNTGIELYNSVFGNRMTWSAGIFRNTDSSGNFSGDGEFDESVRLTGLPWYEKKGRQLLHLGVSYSHITPVQNTMLIKSQPEESNAKAVPNLLDTGNINTNDFELFNTELSLVDGPGSVQGERMEGSITRLGGLPVLYVNGWYLEGTWFLTGENRNYNTKSAAFGATHVNKSIEQGGPGAWYVGLRFSSLGTGLPTTTGSSKGVTPLNPLGQLDDTTYLLGWQLNDVARIRWNYILSSVPKVGKTRIFEMRSQFSF